MVSAKATRHFYEKDLEQEPVSFIVLHNTVSICLYSFYINTMQQKMLTNK